MIKAKGAWIRTTSGAVLFLVASHSCLLSNCILDFTESLYTIDLLCSLMRTQISCTMYLVSLRYCMILQTDRFALNEASFFEADGVIVLAFSDCDKRTINVLRKDT